MACEPSREQVPSNDGTANGHAGWRIAATVALLATLAWFLDTKAVATALAGADALPILAALLLVQAQIVLSAWRWRLIAERLGLRLPLGLAVGEYYVASLLNLVLPGGVPGDALRAVRLAKAAAAPAWRPVVRSIILERAAGQMALAGVMVVGFAAWPLVLEGRVPDEAAWLGVGVLVAGCVIALMLAILARGGPAAMRSAVAGLGVDLFRALAADGAWLTQGILNLAIVASYVAAFALAAAALGHPVPWVGWFTVVPVVLFSMIVPVTIGGWGVREAIAASLWPLLGLDPTIGFATSVLYGLIAVIGSLPGAAFLVFRLRGDARPAI
ncbi:lysylphosphatidylglycerol synthase transmembrane domain-containing protein [Shumkonia mesophila]|uniref:lysylphosphatidylglycerol synthase transmembrane domain-containing protein n=1 Tax=Shumkonia mesophila TaxID=2838854 RepID=UPI00293423FE|nr:lysylphosphatidylglycerol synthase transmembrane domain-containing protein [Shumkonia mesophila]